MQAVVQEYLADNTINMINRGEKSHHNLINITHGCVVIVLQEPDMVIHRFVRATVMLVALGF